MSVNRKADEERRRGGRERNCGCFSRMAAEQGIRAWTAGGWSLDRRLPQLPPCRLLSGCRPSRRQLLLFFLSDFTCLVFLSFFNCKMHLLRHALQLGLLALTVPSVYATSSWGFSDATVSVQAKGAGVGAGFQEKYAAPFDLKNNV
jgi:hypothetical protein